MQVSVIVLIVKDIKKSTQFYTDKLGFKLAKSAPGYAEFKTKNIILELMDESAVSNLADSGYLHTQKAPKSFYLAFAKVKDVDKLYSELKQKGIKFIQKPETKHWGEKVAYFVDPDDNVWEVSGEVDKPATKSLSSESQFKGLVIEESLADKKVLEKLRIISTEVEPVTKSHKTPWLSQWTIHEFVFDASLADDIAKELSKSLETEHKSWYTDFRNNDTVYVIFPNKVFKYKKGNKKARQEVIKYGIKLGIPAKQLDFGHGD